MKKLTAFLVLLSMLLTGCAQAEQWEESGATLEESVCTLIEEEKDSEVPLAEEAEPLEQEEATVDKTTEEEDIAPAPREEEPTVLQPTEESADTTVEQPAPEEPVETEKKEQENAPPEITGTPVKYSVKMGNTDFTGINNASLTLKNQWYNEPGIIASMDDLRLRAGAAPIQYYKSTADGKMKYMNWTEINTYDEAFFEENVLVPFLLGVSYMHPSNVLNVTKEDGKLTIWSAIDNVTFPGGPCVYERFLYCIEIPKDEVVDCKEVEVKLSYFAF